MRFQLVAFSLALLALGGCAALHPPGDKAAGYRDQTAIIGGTTRFDLGRFTGDWVTRACLGPCAPTVSFTQSLTGAVIETDARGSRAYLPDGPGILRASEGDGVLVVMWVDEGFRTAAIGTASGTRAAIIDRGPKGGGDRVAAAREILDFNGWDVSQLRSIE